MNKKFYVTCAIPYVNAAPHIGHALEFVQGDVIARYHRLLGEEVRLLSGGDENALKNVQAAEKAGVPVQQFIDDNTQKFLDLTKALGCKFDIWQKGSDQKHHFPASQELWNRCNAAGDIYKKSYEGLYCVGCETFYEKEELNENGECFEHPGKKLDVVKEENYFFRLSKYQQQIIALITSGNLTVVPDARKNEVLSFLKQPLQDISISRSNERARNWGVPVPGDDSQRMYVWFDALNIYQSGIGFGWDDEQYRKWWPADVHVIGKGISRFHAVYWPAFLLSAGLPTPKAVFVHGYFTVNGQKMSKTLGNVIDPIYLINKYGSDALRYYFLKEIPPFADGDFSEDRFNELYHADLAKYLGNLAARIERFGHTIIENDLLLNFKVPSFSEALNDDYKIAFESYQLKDAIDITWKKIKDVNDLIDKVKPWNLSIPELKEFLDDCIPQIIKATLLLQPFLPEKSKVLLSLIDLFLLNKIESTSHNSLSSTASGSLLEELE